MIIQTGSGSSIMDKRRHNSDNMMHSYGATSPTSNANAHDVPDDGLDDNGKLKATNKRSSWCRSTWLWVALTMLTATTMLLCVGFFLNVVKVNRHGVSVLGIPGDLPIVTDANYQCRVPSDASLWSRLLGVFGQTVWLELQAKLPKGAVSLPADAEYEEGRSVLIGNPNRRRSPLAVVRCTKPDHVSATIRFARKHGFCVTPKSSGAAVDGRSVRDGRIVIDLSGMDRVTFDPLTTTMVVGAGANTKDLVAGAKRVNLFTAWGGCPQVSAASFYTGGGEGLMVPMLGMGVDVVTEFGLVLANGTSVSASQNANPDLFWALRGGHGPGPQFGVVTSVRVQMFPSPTNGITSVSLTVSGPELGTALTRLYYKLVRDLPETAALGVNWIAAERDAKVVTSISGWLYMDEEAGRGVIEPFVKNFPNATLEIANNDVFKSSEDYLALWATKTLPRGTWAYQHALGDELSHKAIDALYRTLGDAPKEVANGKNGLFFSRRAGVASHEPAGGSAMPGRHHLGGYLFLGISDGTKKSVRTALNGYVDNLYEKVGPYLSDLKYPNYPCHDCKDALQSYYGKNLNRLRKIKQLYDPAQFFNFHQSITF